jgi:hypothetical protein
MKKITYKIFPWGIRTKDFEKTLKDVEEFANKSGIEIIAIMNFIFGIIVWYKIEVFKTASKDNP